MTYLLIGGIGKINSELRHYVVSVTHGGWMLFWHKSKYSSLNIGLTPWRRAAVFSHPATVRKDKYKKSGFIQLEFVFWQPVIETHIFTRCGFSDFHFIFWRLSKWVGQARYCIFFSIFYFFEETQQRRMSVFSPLRDVFTLRGLWPVEEEEFSDIISGHTSKSRFSF